jgi:hypothetical protein
MNLIDLYVREVGRSLPAPMREDIEKEIRSSIEDTLEDQSAAQGRPPDEAMIVAVLLKLGSPEKVAASYLPPRYLIGPTLFPTYLSVLRVIVTLVSVLVVLGYGLSIGAKVQEPGSLITILVQGVANLAYGVLQAAAWVTFIFAMVQWSAPTLKLPVKTWDPRQLKAEPDPERVKISEQIGEIAGLIFGLIIFNLYPEWIGMSILQNGQWVHVTVLAPAFATYLPWLSVIWITQICRDVWLASRGRWSTLLRWINVGIGLASAAMAAWMLSGPALTAIAPAAFAHLGWDIPSQAALQLDYGLNLGIRLAIGLGLAFGIFNLGKDLYRLLLRDRLPVHLSANH